MYDAPVSPAERTENFDFDRFAGRMSVLLSSQFLTCFVRFRCVRHANARITLDRRVGGQPFSRDVLLFRSSGLRHPITFSFAYDGAVNGRCGFLTSNSVSWSRSLVDSCFRLFARVSDEIFNSTRERNALARNVNISTAPTIEGDLLRDFHGGSS